MTTLVMSDVAPSAEISRRPTREMAVVTDESRGMVLRFQLELDAYYKDVANFHNMDGAAVLRNISGIAGRCIQMRADLQRSGSARANKFRTSELDPLIDALDLQFKIHSRLISVNQLDWDMSKGQ